MPGPSAKELGQAGFLRNRVAKNEKHQRKWARNAGISAFRVYDKDIPEIPLAIDLFRTQANSMVRDASLRPDSETASSSRSTNVPTKRIPNSKSSGLG